MNDEFQNGKYFKKYIWVLVNKLAEYRSIYEVLRDEKFIGTSQKSVGSRQEPGRDDNKGDWDGTRKSDIWMELTRLLDDPLPKGDLITSALRYLKNAWASVMAYRNDGRYCIDNSIAERSIRPMAIERKNKMAFGSHKGAESSVVYHTFIATCKVRALSFHQLLKDAFTAFMEGHTDLENLTLALLGKTNQKNQKNNDLYFSSCV